MTTSFKFNPVVWVGIASALLKAVVTVLTLLGRLSADQAAGIIAAETTASAFLIPVVRSLVTPVANFPVPVAPVPPAA